MNSTANRVVTLLLLPLIGHAQSVDLVISTGSAETTSTPSVSQDDHLGRFSAVLLKAACDSTEITRENGTHSMLSVERKQKLERGIDEAYLAAHRASAEDVTNLQDGTDRVYRIKTSLGVNVCLNWRDLDRFNSSKGKTLFVAACNR
jgi:hypothetical protein